MNGIGFEYPIIAGVVLLLALICLKFCKPKSISLYFPNATLLKKSVKKRNLLLNFVKFMMLLLAIVALSSPFRSDDIVINRDKGYEISLILDASGSMEQLEKFKIVKSIVNDFIDRREHDKLALTIFADFAYVAVPLTYDKKSIKRLLDRVEVGIAGKNRTALYEALFLSANLFKKSKSKEKIAILLTDGVDNVNNVPLDVAIKRAKKYGIKVYTIGVGGVGDFNPAVLRKIADKTGGKYYNATTIQELKDIYDEIDRLEKSEIETNKFIKKSYFFIYPLGGSLLFLVLYLLLINRGARDD
jgi:Ca-activated chloride channel family protein